MPTDPHVIDTNLLNNDPPTATCLPALLPSNPTATMTIDEGNNPADPGNTYPAPSGTPPLDDDCLIASACEMEWQTNQPGGNPLHASRLKMYLLKITVRILNKYWMYFYGSQTIYLPTLLW